MAGRPYKEGLDYFSIDTEIEADPKIEQLIIAHPDKGYEVFLRLLTRIYKEYGYFMEWNPRQCRYLAAKFGTTKEKMTAIIDFCIEEGLFNQEKYNRFGILTSRAIQDRYMRYMTRRRKIFILRDFSLFSLDLIEEFGLQKKAYYRYYDDITAVFVDGVLHPDWARMAKLELVEPAPPAAPAPQLEEPPEEKPLNGSHNGHNGHKNGRQYGSPGDLPASFDWEQEKSLLLHDEEWKHLVCRNFNLGTWEAREFKPDIEELDKSLEQYFKWVELSGDKKTARTMKSHFANWYPLRQGQKKNTRRSALHHLGDQDFENQKKW